MATWVTDFRQVLLTPFGPTKLLTTVAFIYMMRDGVCSPVVLCIILAREFAVSGLRMVAAGAKDGKVIAANMWGKVKTVLQMLTIIFYFFGVSLTYGHTMIGNLDVWLISHWLCWLVAAATAISGIKYLWDKPQLYQYRKVSPLSHCFAMPAVHPLSHTRHLPPTGESLSQRGSFLR